MSDYVELTAADLAHRWRLGHRRRTEQCERCGVWRTEYSEVQPCEGPRLQPGFALFGGASHIRRWGVVCYGPADGVCSVDEQGCGYCRSECRSPKERS